MVNGDSGTPKNTPAPWVPYTRAGLRLRRGGARERRPREHRHRPERRHDQGLRLPVLPSGTRPQASNAAPPGTAARQLAQTDFVGIAIHCAQPAAASAPATRTPGPISCRTSPAATTASRVCSEPSTSTRRSPAAARVVNNLNGQPITDPFDQPGFPGFDGLFATTTLALHRADAGGRGSRSRSATSRTRTTSTGSRARSTRPAVPARPTTSSS